MKVASLQVKAQNRENAEKAWMTLKNMMLTAGETHDLLIVPESAYPAYFLSPTETVETQPVEDILKEVRAICQQTNTYIAFGYADGKANTASLFDRKGKEIARKEKSYMWHFDSHWFESGKEVVTAETEFGRVALVICADARLPELVREVALDGAKLVIDLANLTASGPYMEQLTNAQCEYMLSTRARENQVWLAVSDKWGVEADTVTYAGRSAIYRPDGTCVEQAPTNQDAIVSVKIPVDETGKIICESDESLPIPRPERYTLLNKDTHELPVYQCLTESVIPELLTPYITISCNQGTSWDLAQNIKQVRRLTEHEPDFIVLPAHKKKIDNITPYQTELKESQVLLLSDMNEDVMRSRLITKQKVLGTYSTLHASKTNQGEKEFPLVIQNQFGNIGMMHGKEALIPEVARCIMLAGADLIVWPHVMTFEKALPLARTRASENKIFIVGVYSREEGDPVGEGCSFIVNPDGNLIAATLLNREVHATGVFCPLIHSRVKFVVPSTHIVFDREPKHYKNLTRHKSLSTSRDHSTMTE